MYPIDKRANALADAWGEKSSRLHLDDRVFRQFKANYYRSRYDWVDWTRKAFLRHPKPRLLWKKMP